MKQIKLVQTRQIPHWVGNGFHVRTIFSYQDLGQDISPFLMLDYAERRHFEPTTERRGVGEHPHRGFETVTLVYDGEIEHRDSAGGGGLIKKGDVQWMTAASGLVHDEFHGHEYAQTGGPFEMVQLWVNLPKKNKMNPPRYQGLKKEQIPVVDLNLGTLRVIAGKFHETTGAALTFSEINLWDIQAQQNHQHLYTVPEGHTCSIFVLSGQIKVNNDKVITDAELAVLENAGTEFNVCALTDARYLFLGGAPLNEPIVGYGPFVMNTEQEIRQAFLDFQKGKMGQL